MLTMITNSWRAEHHVLSREGTAALCRKNLTPYEWPTYGPNGRHIGTTTAISEVAGETSARLRDDHRVTCLACIRKLAKILDAAYPEAHHLYGDVLARVALGERAAHKATVTSHTQTAPVEESPSYLIMNTRTGTTYRILGTGPAENAPHMTAVWVQQVGEQGAQRWSPDMLASSFHDIVAVDSEGKPQTREHVADVDDLGRRVQQTASGHWISFPSPVAEPRHEVAEHCGIADSELPATLPASPDRLLGQALYFIRELAGITVRHQRSAAEQVTIERARKFLAEIERGA